MEPRPEKLELAETEKPTKKSRKEYYRKRYWRMVPDPENAGKLIALGALEKRKHNAKKDKSIPGVVKMVVDPASGRMITQQALYQKRYRQKMVADPENPSQKISRAALRNRDNKKRIFVDKETGELKTKHELDYKKRKLRKTKEQSTT